MELILGSEAPVELSLLAAAIARNCEGPVSISGGQLDDLPSSPNVTIRGEEIDGEGGLGAYPAGASGQDPSGTKDSAPDTLEVRTGDHVTIVASRSPVFHFDESGNHWEVPWFVPLDVARAAPRGGRLRIGIAGGADDRRLRMSWKTIAELRRRKVRLVAVAIGEGALSSSADERPDELHVLPAPAEYLALLDRLDLVLECTDSFGTESFLAVAARNRGIAVVAHRDRMDLIDQRDTAAGMWSADGFAEAVTRGNLERRAPRDPAESLAAILERVAGR